LRNDAGLASTLLLEKIQRGVAGASLSAANLKKFSQPANTVSLS
jgi:hypothetical protein